MAETETAATVEQAAPSTTEQVQAAPETTSAPAAQPAQATETLKPADVVNRRLQSENARLVRTIQGLQQKLPDAKGQGAAQSPQTGASGLPQVVGEEDGMVRLADGSEMPKQYHEAIVGLANTVGDLRGQIERMNQSQTEATYAKNEEAFYDSVLDEATAIRAEVFPGFEGKPAEALDTVIAALAQAELGVRRQTGDPVSMEMVNGAMIEAFNTVAQMLATGQKAQAAADEHARATAPVTGGGQTATTTVDPSKMSVDDIKANAASKADGLLSKLFANRRGSSEGERAY